MNPAVLVDGVPDGSLAARDRGFCYGDGLFETVRFEAGRAPLWARHMRRLAEGCERLGLPTPDTMLLADEAHALTANRPRAVVRITLSRGTGARGYRPPADAQPTRVVSAADLDDLPGDWYRRGIRVRFCRMRLAIQPALAGLKHLNRLEQVLARAEWSDPGVGEGLMCDTAGRVICATAANLFLVHDGQLLTPSLQRCGVAGVARAELLGSRDDAEVRDLTMDDLMTADEVFLSNAVRGVLPVAYLDASRWDAPGPVTRACMAHWRALGFRQPEAA